MIDARVKVYRLMARLMAGGVPIVQMIEIAADEAGDPRVREALLAANEQIRTGDDLSTSLSGSPDLFSPVACELIRAGEYAGLLNTVLMYMTAPGSPFVTGYSLDRYPFIKIMDLCIRCGTGLIPGLKAMIKELEGSEMQMVAELMHKELEQGGHLHTAARALPWLFPEPLPTMIESAEQAGLPDRAFETLAKMAEKGIVLEQEDSPHIHDALRRFVFLFAALLDVGTPFSVALPVLAAAEKHERFRSFLKEAAEGLKDDVAVYEVMENYTDMFPRSFITVFYYAEADGDMVKTLGRMLEGMEEGVFLPAVDGDGA